MSEYTKGSKRRFRRWWRAIKRKTPVEQTVIFERWLKFATRTVAIQGDQHQQQVVYTTYNRFTNSKYKTLRRWQAIIVYDIVNQKQLNYKTMRNTIEQQVRQELTASRQPVVVKRTRRVIASSKGGGNVRIG